MYIEENYTDYDILCHMVFYVTMVTFLDDTSYEWVNIYCYGWWMSLFIGENRYLLLWTTCDEMFSWMIEYWMRTHLGSDSYFITANLWSPQNWEGMTNNGGVKFSVGDTIRQFTIGVEQEN